MPDVWDGAAADAMLAAHEFRQLDALLRAWIDGARSHEAVDWVDARAEEGHVPVLYHAVRNLAKGGRGGALGGAEFRRVFRLALLLLVRAAQDVLAISLVQGQPPRAATFGILRDKAFGWLAAQFPVARWPPLAEVLDEVARALPDAPPLPAWVLASGPGIMSAYLHIGAHIVFDNPSDKAVGACQKTRVPLDEERARVAATFFAMVGGMSWEGVTAMAVSAFLGSTSSNGAAGSTTSSPSLAARAISPPHHAIAEAQLPEARSSSLAPDPSRVTPAASSAPSALTTHLFASPASEQDAPDKAAAASPGDSPSLALGEWKDAEPAGRRRPPDCPSSESEGQSSGRHRPEGSSSAAAIPIPGSNHKRRHR
jgi:hypothetical protein